MTTSNALPRTQEEKTEQDKSERLSPHESQEDPQIEWRINIDQCVIREYNAAGFKLDIVDAAILSAIQKLHENDSGALRKTHDGYVWANHAWFARQYPLLGLTESGLRKRFRNLCKSRVLERKHVPAPGGGGRNNAYYRTAQEYQELIRWWDEKRNIRVDQSMHPNEQKAKLRRHQESKPAVGFKPMELADSRSRDQNGRFAESKPPSSESKAVAGGITVPSPVSQSYRGQWPNGAAYSLSDDAESGNQKSEKGNATAVASRPRGYWYREYWGERYPVSDKNWLKLLEKVGDDEEKALSIMDSQYNRKVAYGRAEDVKDYAWLALQYLDSGYYENDLERQNARR